MERERAPKPIIEPPKPREQQRMRPFAERIKTISREHDQRLQEAEASRRRAAKAMREGTREEGRLQRAFQRLNFEEHLFKKQLKLLDGRKKEVEEAWGEHAKVVLIHTHTSGSRKNGYPGSPDGIFSLDTERPAQEGNPRLSTLLNAMLVDAIFVTDHDAENFGGLNKALTELNAKEKCLSFFGGTEVTSKEGHFIILEAGKPVRDVPPAKTPAREMAEWAFRNGYDIMIPHPDPSRTDPKSMAERAFGIDIGIEKEVVEDILRLADKHDRLVYIAKSNGTTEADYKARLLGSRNHRWQFWRPERADKKIADLYARRAVWVDEADGHIKREFSSKALLFRESEVAGPDGKVSAVKIHDAIKKQRKLEAEAKEEGGRLGDKDSLMVSFSADEGFNLLDKAAKIPYYLTEYARLITVWLGAVLTGEAKQYAEAPKRTPQSQMQKMAQYEAD